MILSGSYVSVQTVLEVVPRRGSYSDDKAAFNSLLHTAENRFSSLCEHLTSVLQVRFNDNPTHSIIATMGNCLDLEKLTSVEEIPVILPKKLLSNMMFSKKG